MEKIESIEHLDALGVKICEMLQVGIDKANTVVPETLQQMVAWTLYNNAIMSLFLVAIIALLTWIMIPLCKKCISVDDDPVEIVYGAGAAVCLIGITMAYVH